MINITRPTVELIASGYEWNCPTCNHLNHEIEYTEKVICKDCRDIFLTEPPEHAYGGENYDAIGS